MATLTGRMAEATERETFDHEAALDDPDLVGLDIGRLLVRRLIEDVKQNAFLQADYYGRTGYMVTQAVDKVTALIHILACYVVSTDSISIIGELPGGCAIVRRQATLGGNSLSVGRG